MENEEFDDISPEEQVEAFKRAIAKRIVLESEKLVDVLFTLAYNPETNAKVALSAISMLLDRGVPKLGVQHTKEEETTEKGSRKALREEIEGLLSGNEVMKEVDEDDYPEDGRRYSGDDDDD